MGIRPGAEVIGVGCGLPGSQFKGYRFSAFWLRLRSPLNHRYGWSLSVFQSFLAFGGSFVLFCCYCSMFFVLLLWIVELQKECCCPDLFGVPSLWNLTATDRSRVQGRRF